MNKIRKKMNFGEVVVETSPNKTIYKTTKETIYSFTTNWKHNRPADSIRIEAIKNYYVTNEKTWIDHIVYAWYYENQLHIYDGWNRYLAAYPEMNMLLSVSFTNDPKDIIQDFTILNSAVSVPDIYNGHESIKKDLLCEVCNRFDAKYGVLKKASKNPHVPHYNRDNLMQLLSNVDVPYDTLTIEDVLSGIEKTSDEIKTYKIKFSEKAKSCNMYLFASKGLDQVKLLQKHIAKKQETSIFKRIFS